MHDQPARELGQHAEPVGQQDHFGRRHRITRVAIPAQQQFGRLATAAPSIELRLQHQFELLKLQGTDEIALLVHVDLDRCGNVFAIVLESPPGLARDHQGYARGMFQGLGIGAVFGANRPARGDSPPQLPQFAVEQRFADLDETVGCQPDLRGTAQGRHEQGPFVVASRAQQVTRSHHIAQCIRDHQTQTILVRHWQMLDGHTPFEGQHNKSNAHAVGRGVEPAAEQTHEPMPVGQAGDLVDFLEPRPQALLATDGRRAQDRGNPQHQALQREQDIHLELIDDSPLAHQAPPRRGERRGTGFEHETHVGARVTTAQPQPQKPANPVRVARPGFGTQEFGTKKRFARSSRFRCTGETASRSHQHRELRGQLLGVHHLGEGADCGKFGNVDSESLPQGRQRLRIEAVDFFLNRRRDGIHRR